MNKHARRSLPLFIRIATLVIALPILMASGSACNIPVFRYALERWQPDVWDMVLFHDGPLSATDATAVAVLESFCQRNGGHANVRLVQHQIGVDEDPEMNQLWQSVGTQANQKKPYLVVRSRVAKGKVFNSWQGALSEFQPQQVFSSPVRKELSRRLLTGNSTVWLVLKCSDDARNKQITSLLQDKLKQLGQDMPLPEGIGLPGSELLSEVPLFMKFSILEIDPNDEKEAHLTGLLGRLAPDAIKAGQPLVVPVFGRGRALEVIPADQLKESLIEDLTVFLCGACSCQVKEMNPGFDLLMLTDWKTALFGEDGNEPVDTKAKNLESDGLPVLVPIPSGRGKR